MTIEKAIYKDECPPSLEALAYRFLSDKFDFGKRVSYSQARTVLCRLLHVNRTEARQLIIRMSRKGFLVTNRRGILLSVRCKSCNRFFDYGFVIGQLQICKGCFRGDDYAD